MVGPGSISFAITMIRICRRDDGGRGQDRYVFGGRTKEPRKSTMTARRCRMDPTMRPILFVEIRKTHLRLEFTTQLLTLGTILNPFPLSAPSSKSLPASSQYLTQSSGSFLINSIPFLISFAVEWAEAELEIGKWVNWISGKWFVFNSFGIRESIGHRSRYCGQLPSFLVGEEVVGYRSLF